MLLEESFAIISSAKLGGGGEGLSIFQKKKPMKHKFNLI